MDACQLYPQFQVLDAWGQLVTFEARGGKYYRHRADADPVGLITDQHREIPKATFALALLNHHEELASLEKSA